MMEKSWALQDAKARFSEVVRETARGAQRITLHGEETAFVISAEEYRRLKKKPPRKKAKSLYELLRSAPKVPGFKLPERKYEPMRKVF
jgi:prevent-host-death family protein